MNYTPSERPVYEGRYQSQATVEHPTFGTATEYVFSGGRFEGCTAKCIDYLIDDGSGGGFAVLAGGEDFELAKRVAQRTMQTLRNGE